MVAKIILWLCQTLIGCDNHDRFYNFSECVCAFISTSLLSMLYCRPVFATVSRFQDNSPFHNLQTVTCSSLFKLNLKMIEAISETICIHYILTYIHVYTEEITTIYTHMPVYTSLYCMYISQDVHFQIPYNILFVLGFT